MATKIWTVLKPRGLDGWWIDELFLEETGALGYLETVQECKEDTDCPYDDEWFVREEEACDG